MRPRTVRAFMLAMVILTPITTTVTQTNPDGHTSHPTIHIVGNSNFTPNSGVIQGNGSITDPYIISGWDLNPNGNIAIEINNTDAYFRIQDNDIHSKAYGQWPLSPSKYEGIRLTNVTNAVIEKNKVWTSQGIRITDSKSLLVDTNGIYSNAQGLTITNSTGITVRSNTIGDDTITVTTTTNFHFYHNSLIRSQALSDAPDNKTLWDNGYPSGGNFWSDYYLYFPNGGMDRCSGPSQSLCPAADGIGDKPYNITNIIQDRYPLVRFYALGPNVLAPRWPTPVNMNATQVGPTSLTLTWTKARDELAVTSYLLYQGARQCGGDQLITTLQGNTTSYTITGLSSGTTYVFKIEASDSGGNVSCLGPSLQVTTPSWLQIYWFFIPIPIAGVASAIAVPSLLRSRHRNLARTIIFVTVLSVVAALFYYLVSICGLACWAPPL